MEYLDFDLEISPGAGREYPIVARSLSGDARRTMLFPFDEVMLESHLKDLQIALLRSGGEFRAMLSPEEQTVQDFGQSLFNAVFGDDVRSLYDTTRREARSQGKGVRLKLRVRSPQLAALPWEFLYDPRQNQYVCRSINTPVVRYLELLQPIQPLTVKLPLRILGLIASPNDLPKLNIEREKERVEQAIKSLQARGMVELHWLAGQTWRDLQRTMRSGPWHIFHFIGHGMFDRNAQQGIVALADEYGDTHRFYASDLALLLADHDPMRLAVLNACEGGRAGERDIFSSTASILVSQGLPAVIAMQYQITDRAAIEFAQAFYESLTDGVPVDAAVVEARKAISVAVANTVEWGTPVLYMRSVDGVLFNFKAETEAERLVRQRAEQDRLAREQAEAESLMAQKAEEVRLARAKVEQERLAEEKVEAERIERERAEQERRALEKAERERLARERAEAERVARAKAEAEKLAILKTEEEHLATERSDVTTPWWKPALSSIVGWGFGAGVGLWIGLALISFFSQFDWNRPVVALLSFPVCGAICGVIGSSGMRLTIRWAAPTIDPKHTSRFVRSWVIAMAIGWALSIATMGFDFVYSELQYISAAGGTNYVQPDVALKVNASLLLRPMFVEKLGGGLVMGLLIGGAVGGLIGGIATGRMLVEAKAIRPSQIMEVIYGWVVSQCTPALMCLAGLIAAEIIFRDDARSYNGIVFISVLIGVLAIGVVGSLVMFRQISKARDHKDLQGSGG